MADLSNKSLALLLIVAIVISISGTMMSLNKISEMQGQKTGVTGFATANDQGTGNFSINSTFSIQFLQNRISFGTGRVNTTGGYTTCTVGTNHSPRHDGDSSNGCIRFDAPGDGLNFNLTIENDGNIDANVSLNFSANETTFVGGTSPELKFHVNDTFGDGTRAPEPGSCATFRNGSSVDSSADNNHFRALDHSGAEIQSATADNGIPVCEGLGATAGANMFTVSLFVTIPDDAESGDHAMTITATGCDDASCMS